MKIVIPMAGRGTRLRPHTLTTPKPLIPIAGKPIVQRLVEDIAKVCDQEIEEIGFIIGDFGKEVEEKLLNIAQSVGAEGKIYYQEEALGTAHAILCAAPSLDGNVVVAFADTLFKADFTLDSSQDGIIWVKQVEDPSAFGVVKMDDDTITDFVEKPQEFVSDLAIIGIYYFKDGKFLKDELQYLIDNNVIKGGEYQLTDTLENMKNKGTKFVPGQVTDWLDCGNKDATVNTNQVYLQYLDEKDLISPTAEVKDSVVIPPVYLAPGVKINNTVIGPYVSVGENTVIENTVIKNTIVQGDSHISGGNIENSMLGSKVTFEGRSQDLSIGDFNVVKN